MRFASLGSGSQGNATVVASGDTCVLIDCGFGRRDTESRLARLGVSAEDLDAILVTHEHSDHCAGVASLSRRYDIPVFLSHGTAASGKLEGCAQLFRFNAEDCFEVGELGITAVPVPHDAREPVQYRLQSDNHHLGVLTDLGSITPYVLSAFAGVTGLLLEFNHDLDLLMNGPYPPSLKRRVAGDFGHLNNQQSVQFLQSLDTSALRTLVAGHLSQKNNSLALTEAALASAADSHQARVHVACQDLGFDWLDLDSADVSVDGLSALG